MKSILIAFGTRPELIKLAPLILALKENPGKVRVLSCSTGQHRELLDQVLTFFGITPDIDLGLMSPNQSLEALSSRCLTAVGEVLNAKSPDLVVVQGDTTTAFITSLATFYRKIPVAHVEAGLRSDHKLSPFPEEMNRRLLSCIADFHFAPTQTAVDNLLAERIPAERVHLVGNTGIDALLWGRNRARPVDFLQTWARSKTPILLTLHRRESFGTPLKSILNSVRDFLEQNPTCSLVYPVHPNPNVFQIAHEVLGKIPNAQLTSPLSYGDAVWTMDRCQFVLTDSGGIQEEAPTLGKPVLVLRENTERPEAVEAGCARLVGYDREIILKNLRELTDRSSSLYSALGKGRFIFGDGTSAKKITSVLIESLSKPVEKEAAA